MALVTRQRRSQGLPGVGLSGQSSFWVNAAVDLAEESAGGTFVVPEAAEAYGARSQVQIGCSRNNLQAIMRRLLDGGLFAVASD